MSPVLEKLIGQAVIRLINGDKCQAAELSAKAHEMWMIEDCLHATVEEILNYKNKGRKSA